MRSPPDSFDGNFETYFEEYVRPSLPSRENVSAFHRLFTEYLNNDPFRFVARNFGPYQRSAFWFEGINNEFAISDNEAALWFYGRVCEGNWKDFFESIDDAIQRQIFPIAMSTEGEERRDQWATWGRKSWEREHFSVKGLMHAHLFDASKGLDNQDLSVAAMRKRMVRLIHPANHFPVPSHTTRKRRFRSRLAGARDLSEGNGVKAYVASSFSRIYDDIWHEFLILADSNPDTFPVLAPIPFSFSTATENADAEIFSQGPTISSQERDQSDFIQQDVWVSQSAIEEGQRRARQSPDLAARKYFYYRTNIRGIRFEMEKPSQEKFREVLSSAIDKRVVFGEKRRTGHRTKPQYSTQFGSCYLMKTSAWKVGQNYIDV